MLKFTTEGGMNPIWNESDAKLPNKKFYNKTHPDANNLSITFETQYDQYVIYLNIEERNMNIEKVLNSRLKLELTDSFQLQIKKVDGKFCTLVPPHQHAKMYIGEILRIKPQF